MRIVAVEWLDSMRESPVWCEREAALDLAWERLGRCFAVGIEVEGEGEALTLAMCMSPGEMGNLFRIPRAAVLSVEEIATFEETSHAQQDAEASPPDGGGGA